MFDSFIILDIRYKKRFTNALENPVVCEPNGLVKVRMVRR